MDISKFNFGELFSNDTGKTSGSGFSGVIGFLIASASFLLGVVDKMWISHTPDIMINALTFAGICAGLLGLRKIFNNKEKIDTKLDNTEENV